LIFAFASKKVGIYASRISTMPDSFDLLVTVSFVLLSMQDKHLRLSTARSITHLLLDCLATDPGLSRN